MKRTGREIALGLVHLLVLGLAFLPARGQTVTATYSTGDISTLYNTAPSNTTTSTCAGSLSVTIPAGNWVTGVSTAYTMTSVNSAYMSEQQSYLYAPAASAGESALSTGTGNEGTFNYSRSNLSFANGLMGTFTIELRAFRQWGGSGCGTSYTKVDNNTWTVTVSYGPIPTCMAVTGLNTSAVTSSGANLNWTAPAVGTTPANYAYEVRTSGAAGSGATGLVTSGTQASTTQPLASLSPGTAYTAYVRANCGGGDFSSWVSTNFTTLITPCTGQPAAGTIAGATGSYTSTNFTLSLSGNSSPTVYSGLTFQWQRSATGLPGSWSNVSSGTGVTVTTSQTAGNYYRAYVVCAAASLSDTTPVKFIQNYCKPSYTSTTNYRIGNVTFGSINNTVANASTNDFTSQSTNVVAGVAGNISVSTYGYTGSAVAADLNNDGDFADADEILFAGVYTAAGPPEVNTYAIAIPAWVPTGSYRMRVFSWGGNAGGGMTPCGSSSYGTFHDYTVNVSNTATCFPPTALNTTNLLATSATLNWTATTTSPASYEWKVMLGNADPNTGTAAASGTVAGTATTTPVTGLTQNTAYKAYVRSVCGAGNTSAWGAALSFSTPVSCFPVTALDVSAIAGNTVTFAWTAPTQGNPVVNYQYELRTAGAAGSGATGLVQTGFSSSTSQLVAGLTSGTSYTFYVRTDCNASDSSSWVSKVYLVPTYVPITITSYNQDVIAEGVAAAASTTTISVDDATAGGANFAYLSSTYRNPATPNTVPAFSLPANGRILNGVKYFQLAPYNQNNSTRLVGNNAFDTMKFFTPRSAKNIYVLAVSGSGSSTVNFKVLFSDGTATDFNTNTINDWYGTFSNTVISAVGRVSRTSNVAEGTGSGSNIGPNLYETALNLVPADTAKTIKAIVATKTNNSGFLNIFGVSIIPSAASCAVPTALATSGTTYNGTGVSWSGNATNYQVSYGTQGTTADNGTLLPPQSSATATLSNLNAGTNYSVYVRALCGNNPGDTSFWVGPVNFATPCAAPVITMGTAADGAEPSPITSCGANDATITLKITTPVAYVGNYDVSYTLNGAAQTLANQSPVNAGSASFLTLSGLSAGAYNNFQLTQTGQTCSSTVLSSLVTINAYTVSGLPTANTSASGTQPAGSNIQYATGSCEPIVKINASSGTLGSVTATVNVSAATTFNGSPYVGRYYDIAVTQANGGTITLYFTDAEIAAYNTLVNGMANSTFPAIGPNGENLRITAFHSAPGAGGSGPFGYSTTNAEVATITGIVHNTSAGRWEVTCTTTGFSGFFAYTNSIGAPLKISLADITASNQGKVNEVRWVTQTEEAGDRFQLEHSIDGRSFAAMATVAAKGAAARYAYTDAQPFAGTTYYRLLMIDKDGRTHYSKVVTAEMKTGSFALQVFPNPVGHELTVKANGANGKGQVQLTDAVGRVIGQYTMDDRGVLKISVTDLAPGIYLLRYDDGSNKRSLKINKY
ncbi:putative secreted protein (Por secretion system target) [Taibaiella chishuiensis]|uniref:Putative secreted protein (Por secretion system target) n=2 Tax=Taibaiella chishuiensis TaxID=1434707 RepID=A0A2P8DAA2_9BACT|nr:putative secreted protein (Por secretion system target) [Taibaiella chishuiensis]